MYSGYGGSSMRTLSTMSLSVRPVRRVTSRSITRSQSFTGVNIQEKAYRNLSAFSTPGLSRKSSRTSLMFNMSTKSSLTPKVPQPEQLDQAYEALKKGLQSCLHAYQTDLNNFNKQIKESKRNSRLGFLYELDKQVKVIERYMRRLEFHLSKIEELYEAYCLQRRLRDGANKMIKAYTASPGSREAKESLAEANKEYKECTENMCKMESDLQNQLGKFHIKMKGLAGFARLCAGDQYEIFMKYGRQRWKLRGRIEVNDKQVWDSEEMVFLPLINEFLSVKVTELKSLANHVVVGNVSCETKDLFVPLPQMVAVDINDLGTIKLNLEVTWNPFDKDESGLYPGTVNIMQRIPNLSPPGTPPLNNHDSSVPSKEHPNNRTSWLNSSESSDESSSPLLSVAGLHISSSQKDVRVTQGVQHPTDSTSQRFRGFTCSTPIANQKIMSVDVSEVSSILTKCVPFRSQDKKVTIQKPTSDGEVDTAGTISPNTGQPLRSLSHISESSADGVLTDQSVGESGDVISLVSGTSVSDIDIEWPSITPEPPSLSASHSDMSPGGLCVDQLSLEDPKGESVVTLSPRTEREDRNTQPIEKDEPYVETHCLPKEGDGLVDTGLEDAMETLVSSLDDYRGQFPDLQILEEELRLLQATLKGSRYSHSPSTVSLSVESALGSFDFLNTSDCEEEEEDKRGMKRRNGRPQQDRGWDNHFSPVPPLTTSCSALDSSLVIHLKNCSAQLLCLGVFGPLRCREMYALDKLLREACVFKTIHHIIRENPLRLRQPAEVLPELGRCLGAVSLWQLCVGRGSMYCVSADTFLMTLSTIYSSMLHERADPVLLCLVEKVLDQKFPRHGNRDKLMVTVFQLWSYLESNGISDIETYITELAEEVWLVQNLSSGDQDVIINALCRPAECSLKREGLHAVAKLLKDPRSKVLTSARSVLRTLSAQPRQREQALVNCLEMLEDDDLDARVCGCKALACLKAKESIEQLVYLCQTDKEEVRDAAKQTLLELGEEGKMAHRHVEISQDTLPILFAPGSMASTAF
ncbi:rho family-interacting cell polarization regulator 1 isoform X2 [Kryptolebias marmoratus]|uniref:rho family-interacting cell polarization regulator 1 isoform X2 n=1 Tax=Kryptolebias marmoratus TaxID=37003 RepID=UPI0007F9426B|nr:rho family-interacting cell polarization regulator 1 isoform X2 [Kryptolebias marmoratus]